MKIDIGNGKILGTKRVSANGQISGFTEFSGREVLVVLPEGEPQVRLDTREYVKELQVAANEYMKVAFDRYKGDLKPKFRTPEAATKDFVDKYAPERFQGLYDKLDNWVRDQVDRAETKVEKVLDKTSREEQAAKETTTGESVEEGVSASEESKDDSTMKATSGGGKTSNSKKSEPASPKA